MEDNFDTNVEFFSHLNLQSDFSLLKSTIQFKQLAERLKELNYQACAIADTDALFGMIQFQECMLDNGIKPITGMRMNIKYSGYQGYCLLYAKNKIGYHNLVKISSYAHLNKPEKENVRFILQELADYNEGILCITGGLGSLIQNIYSNNMGDLGDALLLLQSIFHQDLYLEIESYGYPIQDSMNELYVKLAESLSIECVATNNSRFLSKDDYEGHDAMMALHDGVSLGTIRRHRASLHNYVKSKSEMAENFASKTYFSIKMFENIKVIADKCDFIFKKDKNYMPEFPLPAGVSEKEYFIAQVKQGWKRIFPILNAKKDKLKYGFDAYKKRLQLEVDVISQMGFRGYFLVVADLINWGKSIGIPTGIGRGCNYMNNNILMATGDIKRIKDVAVGDRVFNKKGASVEVVNTFKYECKEELIKIKSYYGDFEGLVLTKDHKVLCEKHKRPKNYENWSEITRKRAKSYLEPSGNLSWIEAKDLQVNDWVYVPFIQHNIGKIINNISLLKYCDNENIVYDNAGCQIIEYRKTNNVVFNHITTLSLKFDRNFSRMLGYFAGNGCLYRSSQNFIEISFHSNHLAKITNVETFFCNLGCRVSAIKDKEKNVTKVTVRSKIVYLIFRELFCDYDYSSTTKHIPEAILNGSVEQIEGFLEGFCKTDGNWHKGKLVLCTSSKSLAYQLRYIILRIGLPSSVITDDRIDLREEFKNRKLSYRIVLPSSSRFGFPDQQQSLYYRKIDGGILLKISSIETYTEDYGGYVYDIEVEGDEKNYLTSSFLVHNSAGGSVVAYCLGIVNIDPLQYDLFFERFINVERFALPDIDMDFCTRRRAEIVEYIIKKYGREYVCKIITFGSLAARAAIKDIGRVLDNDYKEMDLLCKKLPPASRGVTIPIHESLEMMEELRNYVNTDPKLVQVMNYAKVVEDCYKSVGIHAAGVLISPVKLTEVFPLYQDQDRKEICSQFEKDTLEKAGGVKMDILGLTSLTIIDDCVKAITKDGLEVLDVNNLDYDDPKIYELIFQNGNTAAIFQFESAEFAKLCRETKPETLEDLAALNALFRPGPIDANLLDSYTKRKTGKEPVEYTFPVLESVLSNTFGVYVFQEQIMAIFRVLAGYSLGEADNVRKAMGKKKLEEMEKQKTIFIERSLANGYDKEKIEKLWEEILGYSAYCFNKSHAIMYSAIGYQTAYLKCYFPTYFWATVLTHSADKPDEFKNYLEIVRDSFISILPPDINKSTDVFQVEGEQKNSIRYSLLGIKGLGNAVVDGILSIRKEKPFISFYDFITRIDSSVVNKRVLESLIKAGALDSLFNDELNKLANRSKMYMCLEKITDFLNKQKKASSKKGTIKQDTLFDFMENDEAVNETIENIQDTILLNCLTLDKLELLAYEKEVLGLYINGHPTDIYKPFMKYKKVYSIDSIIEREIIKTDFSNRDRNAARPNRVTFLAALTQVIFKHTKVKHEKFAICTLEDATNHIKGYLWNTMLLEIGESKLNEGSIFLIEGDLQQNLAFSEEKVIFVNKMELVDDLIKSAYKGVVFSVSENHITDETIKQFYYLISQHKGDCVIHLEIVGENDSKRTIVLNEKYHISPTASFIDSAVEIFKVCKVYPIE